MQLLFSAPERQYNNTSFDEQRDLSALSHKKLLLVLNIVSLDAGSYVSGYAEGLSGGNTVIRSPIYADAPGQYCVGWARQDYPDIVGHLVVNVVGRVRCQARLFAVDAHEDVPEVI